MSNDFTTFYLAPIDLPIILEPHEFYVSEAKRRLLTQFNDIDREAQEVEERALEVFGHNFDPDRDDPADAYEWAYQKNVSHWLALYEMHNTVTLALAAGMYHQFDKTLREKMIREFSHWNDREFINQVIWNTSFPRLMELLEWVGIEISDKDFMNKINACRLVVNVYKHGDGDGHRELSTNYPEYYPRGSLMNSFAFPFQYDELKLNEVQFDEFSEAIRNFWKNIPEYCRYSQLRVKPSWFNHGDKKKDDERKVSAELLNIIKEEKKSGANIKSIARRYGLSRAEVSRIISD
ncbi:hypothetical protein [Enterobacter asburiae]|uniref:hypothetical protein n=1 Tax=Enterobacter asburiae TaxID=61645 RepID=UPI0034CF0C0D